MKITSLEPQKKDKNRLNLYVDGKFYAGVDISTIARLGFYDGKEIESSDLILIDTEEEYQKCLNRALLIVSQRMQSERELWTKLGKSFEKPVIGKCLDRLRELKYVNDAVFAEMWVRERARTRGKRQLIQELKQKGIKPEIYEPLLGDLDPDEQYLSAYRLAVKKYNPELDRDKNWSRVTGVLSRKGFDYGLIKQVFEDLRNEKTA